MTVKFVQSPALTQDSRFWPITASANETAQVTHKTPFNSKIGHLQGQACVRVRQKSCEDPNWAL